MTKVITPVILVKVIWLTLRIDFSLLLVVSFSR